MGDAGAFSFFPTKNLGGFGDGGMITTNSDEIASEVKVLRNHGSRQQYFYDIMGFNSRLDEIQAVVLRKRMRHLSSWIDARRSHAAYYRKALSGVKGITLPSEPQYATHTYNQFTLLAEHRDELMAFLKTKQVGSAIYYPLALHLQKVYADLGYRAGDLPNSEKVQSQVLSLPIFPELTPTELQEVAQTIIQFYG